MDSSPSRSQVTTAAVVAYFLSAISGIVGVGLIGAVALPQNHAPGNVSGVLSVQFFIGVVFFPVTAFGAMVATGLLRCRNWARIAALVWAVLMVLVSGFALLAGVSIVLQSLVIELKSVFFFSFFGPGLATGVWWLVLFTRNHVIEQFTSK